jgi:Arc/MetJ-type ribon-helix-helix transcriptional regulator
MSVATKVTLTLPSDLLTVVDQYVAAHRGLTRSGVCTDALRAWLKAEQEAEIERYYVERSAEERADDEAWTAVAVEAAPDLWR